MAAEVWGEIYDRLTELVESHRSTLIFVNTRRLADACRPAPRRTYRRGSGHRASRQPGERAPARCGTAPAGRQAEGARRNGVAGTRHRYRRCRSDRFSSARRAASRRSCNASGRSGHGVDALPKGRLFPLTRDDLVESVALLDAVRREELDAIRLQGPALDVLAQQIVAEVAAQEWQSMTPCSNRSPARLAVSGSAAGAKFDQVITNAG